MRQVLNLIPAREFSEMPATAQAYWARPFAVTWVDSHCSTTHTFETEAQAFEYVWDQWARIQRATRARRYTASSLGRARMYTPEGSIALRWLVLADDCSSY